MTEPAPEDIRAAQPADAGSLQRLLPQDRDAEKAALSSLLIDPVNVSSLWGEMGGELRWFHDAGYADIFMEAMFLIAERKPLEYAALCIALRDSGKLERVGGPAAVSDIWNFMPTAVNAQHYLTKMRDKHLLRSVIDVGTRFAAKGYDPTHDGAALLDEFEAKVMRLRARIAGVTASSAAQCVDMAWGDVEWYIQNPGRIRGLSTGFRCIDNICDGLHEEEFMVLAARPGLGKTALAMQIIESLSDSGVQTALFSLEMSKSQLFTRQMFSRARVNRLELKHRALTPTEVQRLEKAKDELRAMRLTVEDSPGMSIQDFRGIARRLVQKGVRAIFVDSMSAMRSDSKEAQNKRDRSVAECAAGFKAAAKELRIPIVVLCHLNRQVDKSEHPPTLSDLRESGAIEQDADTVIMMHQDWQEGVAEIPSRLTFPKQRYGEKNAHCDLKFVKGFVRFEEDMEAAQQPKLL